MLGGAHRGGWAPLSLGEELLSEGTVADGDDAWGAAFSAGRPPLSSGRTEITPKAGQGAEPRGFVPASGGSRGSWSLGRSTARDLWTPEQPTPLAATGTPGLFGAYAGQADPSSSSVWPSSLAGTSRVPRQALFVTDNDDAHAGGLNDHPRLPVQLATPFSLPPPPPTLQPRTPSASSSRVALPAPTSAAFHRRKKSANNKAFEDEDTIQRVTLESLPDEVLTQILKLVQGRRKRYAPSTGNALYPVLFLNRRLYILAAGIAYQNPRPRTMEKAASLLSRLQKTHVGGLVLSAAHSIRHLDLSGAFSENGAAVPLELSAFTRCYRLQSLNLSNASQLDGLATLLREGCTRLHTLVLRDCQAVDNAFFDLLLDDSVFAVKDRVLKRLDFSGCCGVSDRHIFRIVQHLGNHLVSLKLGRCKGLTDAAVARVAEACPALKELDLEQLENLRAATVFGALVIHRRNMQTLETLNIAGIRLLDDLEPLLPVGPASYPRGESFRSLKSLNMSGLPFLTVAVLQVVTVSNPALDVLKVSHCLGLSDSTVAQFRDLKASQDIRTLFLSHTPLPMSSVSRMLSQKLVVLDLSDNAISHRVGGRGRLTDDTVKLVCNTCTNLRALHLARNPQLTDLTLFSLMGLYRSLRKISLQMNTQFSAGNIRSFLNICGRLEWVDVSDIPDLGRFKELRDLSDELACGNAAVAPTSHTETGPSLLLDSVTAINRIRGALNGLMLHFMPRRQTTDLLQVPQPRDEAADDHLPSVPYSAWSSARTTPTKSSKSASLHTSCCPSDNEDGGEEGLHPGIRRSSRLKKAGRASHCPHRRSKYHHLPDSFAQHRSRLSGGSQKRASLPDGARTPPSEYSASTRSTPPKIVAEAVAKTAQSPRRRELASLFAALSSDGGFEDDL
ncbi:hypothetical protein DFJ74DRAFT_358634 [Hyaloraphidium curvatum]|nr:hypothetical protein DFJ74DRAFT_358634 [Hyaloraphidium curvatum]